MLMSENIVSKDTFLTSLFNFLGIIPFFIGKFRPKVLFATTQCFSTLSMLVFAAYNHFREYRQDLITRFFQDPNFLVYYRIHQILSFMNSVTICQQKLSLLFTFVTIMATMMS
mgnify:CR=1 FL=1